MKIVKVWHCIFNDTDKTDIKEEEDAIDRAGNRREFMICSILATATVHFEFLGGDKI